MSLQFRVRCLCFPMLSTFTNSPGMLWGLAVGEGRAAGLTDDSSADVLAELHINGGQHV